MTTRTYAPAEPGRLSWSAIIGGTVVALSAWVLLYSFGLAIGLSSVDSVDAQSLRRAGIGTGIWGLVAPLIALFLGGFVAARTAGIVDRAAGALHGLVLWGVTTLAGFAVMGMALSALVGGVVNLGGKAVGATGAAAAAGAAQGDLSNVAESFGLDANDALGPVNERLRAEGKPPITSDQLSAATKDVVGTAVREGRFDRELFIAAISKNTSLTRADAEDIASRAETQFNQRKADISARAGELKSRAQTGAVQAADVSGKAFWGVFFALLLGLVCAIAGAAIGVGGAARSETRRPITYAQPVTP